MPVCTWSEHSEPHLSIGCKPYFFPPHKCLGLQLRCIINTTFAVPISLALSFLHSFPWNYFLQNLMTNWTYISKALSVLAIDLVAEYIGSVIHGGSVPITISFFSFLCH